MEHEEKAGLYITADETASLGEFLKYLNDSVASLEIRLSCTVYDSNGDTLGRIDFAESGYVFYVGTE